jgi:hypothetical protein
VASGGVNTTAAPSSTRVAPADGVPTVVTDSGSRSLSLSLARTSTITGALPAITPISSSNASGARFCPGRGTTPISTSPMATAPWLSTIE